jgi:hypothetical protein
MSFSSTPQPQSTSPAPARRGRGWIWFFALLLVLTIAAITVQVWYNLGQQLTSAKLEAARERWKKAGPRDYDMEYTIKKLDGSETYNVRVRQGKVVSALRNGIPEDTRLYHYRDVPALFGFLEDFLTRDAQAGAPRTFATATFDPQDGHLIHYVRSVMSARERQEINVQLQPVGT